ncbi:MAG: matrixin family metalloprotease [Planctomycetota bacterium]
MLGLVDLEKMLIPRCGLSFLVRDPQAKRCRSASLAFHIGSVEGSGCAAASVNAALRSACQTWNAALAQREIQLVEVSDPQQASLRFSWVDTYDEDYAFGIVDLAHADYPGTCTDLGLPSASPRPVHFLTFMTSLGRESERWTTSLKEGDHDIETIALHELGHCLGLGHGVRGSVMEVTIPSGTLRRRLQKDDLLQLQEIYGH